VFLILGTAMFLLGDRARELAIVGIAMYGIAMLTLLGLGIRLILRRRYWKR
jgi:hypothetical protein